MLAHEIRFLKNFTVLLQNFAVLLQIFALLLQIFAPLFGINSTEIDQVQSSIISVYFIRYKNRNGNKTNKNVLTWAKRAMLIIVLSFTYNAPYALHCGRGRIQEYIKSNIFAL